MISKKMKKKEKWIKKIIIHSHIKYFFIIIIFNIYYQ